MALAASLRCDGTLAPATQLLRGADQACQHVAKEARRIGSRQRYGDVSRRLSSLGEVSAGSRAPEWRRQACTAAARFLVVRRSVGEVAPETTLPLQIKHAGCWFEDRHPGVWWSRPRTGCNEGAMWSS